jgi:hypothetical protein
LEEAEADRIEMQILRTQQELFITGPLSRKMSFLLAMRHEIQ